MLDTFRSFLAELTGAPRQDRFEENDYRLAAAALLVHVSTVDGMISEAERKKLRAVIKHRFNLDDPATDELIDEATRVEGEAVDLYRFTSLINRALDEDGKRRIVEMVWELIYADGKVSEFEDNVVWRVADLLHISTRERVELRQQVAGQPRDPESTN